jgi:hypothetical protein
MLLYLLTQFNLTILRFTTINSDAVNISYTMKRECCLQTTIDRTVDTATGYELHDRGIGVRVQ